MFYLVHHIIFTLTADICDLLAGDQYLDIRASGSQKDHLFLDMVAQIPYCNYQGKFRDL